MTGKRLELLRELVPRLSRLAILTNIGNPVHILQMDEVRTMAFALGVEVITLEIRRADDIPPAFETLKNGADALYIPPDPLVISELEQIPVIWTHSRHV